MNEKASQSRTFSITSPQEPVPGSGLHCPQINHITKILQAAKTSLQAH